MSIITALLSACLFYLFPFLVGRMLLLTRYKKTIPYAFVSYFVIGAVSVYMAALIGWYVIGSLLPNLSFATILALFLGIGFVIAIVYNLASSHFDSPAKSSFIPVIISIFLASFVYAIWQWHSPYPLNWDMYEHQTLVNNILIGKFSLLPSHVTDTFGFNGYTTLFHSLLALSQIPFWPHMVYFWQSISAIHFTLVILASYFLAKEVTENNTVAFYSVLIGAFIFESSVAFTSLFFIPQTFTAVIAIFLFIQLLAFSKQQSLPPLPLVIVGCLFLFFTHFIIGTAAIAIYAGTYCYFRYKKLFETIHTTTIIEGVLLAVLVGIIVSSFIPLGFINKGEAAAFTFSLPEKFLFMQQAYGFFLLLFFPIGAFTTFKTKKENSIVVLLITCIMAGVVLSQFPYALKFYVLARFFIHLLLAIGVARLLLTIQTRGFFLLANIVLGAVLLGIFITNASMWKNNIQYHTLFAHVSPLEIEAAQFLKTTYANTNAMLVSDPATQNILEAFSTVNTQGGAYTSKQTRDALHAISQATDTTQIKDTIYSIDDDQTDSGKRLIAVSGRYFLWQKQSQDKKDMLSFNIWSPSDLSHDDKQKIAFLLADQVHFHLVYQNPAIAILEVKK